MIPQFNRAMLWCTVMVTVIGASIFAWMQAGTLPAQGWAILAGIGAIWLTFVGMIFVLQMILHKPWVEREKVLAMLQAQNKVLEDMFAVTHRVSTASNEAATVERGMQATVETLKDELKLDGCSLRILDPASGELMAISGCGYRDPNVKPLPIAANQGIAGKAISQKRAVYVEDATKEQDFIPSGEGRLQIASLFCLPLVSQGEVIGVMSGSSRTPRTFGSFERQILGLIAARLGSLLREYSLLPADQRHLAKSTTKVPPVQSS